MKKPLLIVENDSEVKAIKDGLDKGYEMFKEAQEFVKKQQEASWKQLVGSHWEQMENVLKERGVLPEDFCDEKYNLSFSNGVLYLESKDGDGMKEEIENILNRLLNRD